MLTTTEYAILGLLTRGEKSGYDLHKAAERSIGYIWAPAKSQIYKVLPRLVHIGYATRRDVEQTGRPDKQLYRATRAGRRALRAWLETIDPEPVANSDAFLLKVFFGSAAGTETVVAQIEAFRRDLDRLVTEYGAIEQRIRGSARDYFPYLTLQYGLARGRAALAWADDCLRALQRPASRAR